MTAIPHIPLIEITPRLPNPRLWFLHEKAKDRTITPLEAIELEALCRFLEAETEQDNSPTRVAL
jgi:hypothetical protein